MNVTDYFDNVVMELLKMDNNQYDYFCEYASEEEINLVITEKLSYSQKKQIVYIRNKYKKLYEEQRN